MQSFHVKLYGCLGIPGSYDLISDKKEESKGRTTKILFIFYFFI